MRDTQDWRRATPATRQVFSLCHLRLRLRLTRGGVLRQLITLGRLTRGGTIGGGILRQLITLGHLRLGHLRQLCLPTLRRPTARGIFHGG